MALHEFECSCSTVVKVGTFFFCSCLEDLLVGHCCLHKHNMSVNGIIPFRFNCVYCFKHALKLCFCILNCFKYFEYSNRIIVRMITSCKALLKHVTILTGSYSKYMSTLIKNILDTLPCHNCQCVV